VIGGAIGRTGGLLNNGWGKRANSNEQRA